MSLVKQAIKPLSYRDVRVSIKIDDGNKNNATIYLNKVLLTTTQLADQEFVPLTFSIQDKQDKASGYKYGEDIKKQQLKDVARFFKDEEYESYDVKVSTFQDRDPDFGRVPLKELVESHRVEFSLVKSTFYETYGTCDIELRAYKPENHNVFFKVFVNIVPHNSDSDTL